MAHEMPVFKAGIDFLLLESDQLIPTSVLRERVLKTFFFLEESMPPEDSIPMGVNFSQGIRAKHCISLGA
jgi:hypothetical protein